MHTLIRHLLTFLGERIGGRIQRGSLRGACLGAILGAAFLVVLWLLIAHQFDLAFSRSSKIAVAIPLGIVGVLIGAAIGAGRPSAVPQATGVRTLRLWRLNETLGIFLIGLVFCVAACVMPFLPNDPKEPMPTFVLWLFVIGAGTIGIGILLFFYCQVLWIDVSDRIILHQYFIDRDVTDLPEYQIVFVVGEDEPVDTFKIFRNKRLVTLKQVPKQKSADMTRLLSLIKRS